MSDAKPLDIDAILARLPHRFPFLMVDRVLDVVPGKSIVAVKNVSFNEAYFQGHFPGHPVVPGVLIIEALAQAGGVLAYESATAEERMWILYLVGIEETRFKQDLDADSLDLYELVMELEDHYGISVSEEQAARIETVGDAVAFVLEHAPA